MKKYILHLIILTILLLQGCHTIKKRPDNEIRIFCAASLADIITEIKDSFLLQQPVKVKLNIASSGTLARQIGQGNHADIFIPASKQWADYVGETGLFGRQKALYQNTLVLVAPKNSEIDTIDFTLSIAPHFSGYLSMGDPAYVPAGTYAHEALSSLGWYDGLEKRILSTKDVRSALMMVELGECQLGIVYYSDAIRSQKLKILGTFPEDTYEPAIIYALLSNLAKGASTEFYKFLSDKSMKPLWLKYGFYPVDSVPKV